MGVPDLAVIAGHLQTASPYVLLVIFIFGFFRKWWTFGWAYKKLEDELEKSKKVNEEAITMTREAVELANRNTRTRRHRDVEIP
jgi:hypothetical protein